MTQLLTARRRAAEFARAVDDGRHHSDPSLDIPLQLVEAMRTAPAVSMDDRFRAELRIQLLAAAHDELRESDAVPSAYEVATRAPVRQRRLAAAAAALVLVGGTTGVAAASQQALPGDVLYPVKRAMESAELQLAGTAFAHGSELLEQATTRLDEVGGLVARGPNDPGQPVEIDAALTDFTGSAGDGGNELLAVYRSNADPVAIGVVREFTTAAAASLTEFAPSIPPTATDALTDAAATVESLDATARALCPNCAASIPPVTMPTTLMSLDLSSPLSQPTPAGPAEADQQPHPATQPGQGGGGSGHAGAGSQPSAGPPGAQPSAGPPPVGPDPGPGVPTVGQPGGGGSGIPNAGPALPTVADPGDGSGAGAPSGGVPGVPNVGPGVPTVDDPGVPNAGPGVPPDDDPGVPNVGPNVPTVESPGAPTVGPEVPTVTSPGTPTVHPGVPTVDPVVPTTDPVVPNVAPTVPNVAPTVPAVPTVTTPTGGLTDLPTALPEETTLPSPLNPLGSGVPTAGATSDGQSPLVPTPGIP